MWTLQALLAASTVCLGTAVSSLFFQLVSNAAPIYFFSIAVVSPLLGFLCYALIILFGHLSSRCPSQLTMSLVILALPYCFGIGLCFAFTNILVDYGRSGSAAGVPDVSTVLALILMKLVVPISLVLESSFEKVWPSFWQVSGVIIIMLGLVETLYDQEGTNSGIGNRTSQYYFKVLSIILSSLPLASGFYLVKRARQNLPLVNSIELWCTLCVPEFFFSILLAYISQHGQSFHDRSVALADGVGCVLFGIQPADADDSAHCREAAFFLWSGLPFGFAFNLAIPVLIKLKGSTSVPLFRALALPLAAILAMAPFTSSHIRTPFSWDAVVGVFLCTIGLLLYNGEEIKRARSGYSSVVSKGVLVVP